ncbi:putative branched-chain amino acid aminotransferase [Streptomyces sp. Tu6071]|nr:putative branched-chain amino acid aminotransferase [Streptomyces sp. Tu6071]
MVGEPAAEAGVGEDRATLGAGDRGSGAVEGEVEAHTLFLTVGCPAC